MKTKTLVSLGLLTCIGFAGFSGAKLVSAAESTSTGTVTLTDDWQGTVIKPETEGPNTVNPEDGENPDPAGDADLALVFWPDFAFGAHEYDAQKGVKADAAPIELEEHVPGVANSTSYISPLFVQVRSSVAGWKLQANLTEQFSGEKTVEGETTPKTSQLKGSTITLGNNTAFKNTPTDLGKAATAGATSLVLGEKTGAVDVGTLTAAPTDEISINSFLFGNLTTEGEDTTYTGVELDIPKGLKVLDTNYTATITWTLAADAT